MIVAHTLSGTGETEISKPLADRIGDADGLVQVDFAPGTIGAAPDAFLATVRNEREEAAIAAEASQMREILRQQLGANSIEEAVGRRVEARKRFAARRARDAALLVR